MKIRINNLRVRTEAGAYQWEKNLKQNIIINVEYEIDGTKALSADKLENTVDYHPLSNKIIEQIENNRFSTIEYLAGFALDIVMAHDKRILKATVTVAKPEALAYADSASVTVSTER